MFEQAMLAFKLRRGDSDSLRQFFTDNRTMLLTVAACLTNEQQSTYEEIVSEVFVSLAANIAKIPILTGPRLYLLARLLDNIRSRFLLKMYRIQEVPPGKKNHMPQMPAAGEEPPQVVQIPVVTAMAELPLQQREALILRLHAGLSFLKIAMLQGVSHGTARSRYYYAIARLRSMFTAQPNLTDLAANPAKAVLAVRITASDDFDERTSKQMFSALEHNLLLSGSPVGISRSSLIKLAAGTVVVAVAVLLGYFWAQGYGNENREFKPSRAGRQDISKAQGTSTEEEMLEREMKEINGFYAAGDVNKLIMVLKRGRLPAKVMAAYFIEQVGGLAAADELDKLSAKYGAGDPNNPFALAAEKIRARLAVQEYADGSAAEVLMSGVLVDANDKPVAGRLYIYDNSVDTNESGIFEMPVEAAKLREGLIYFAFDAGRKLGGGGLAADENEAEGLKVVLMPVASVSGRVVDANGRGQGAAKVRLEILSPMGTWMDVKELWETAAEPNGSFRFADAVSEVPLRIVAESGIKKTAVEIDELMAGQKVTLGDVVVGRAAEAKREQKQAEVDDILGESAPELKVEKWLNTDNIRLEQYQGRIIVLEMGVNLPEFMPHYNILRGLTQRYTKEQVAVIVVHRPVGGEVTETDLRAFIMRNGIDFPVGIDSAAGAATGGVDLGATYRLYGADDVPGIFVIDKKGKLRAIARERNMVDIIEILLDE